MSSIDELSARKLKQIVQLADEGILTLDADGRIDYVNQHGASILKIRSEDLIGRYPKEVGFPGPERNDQQEGSKCQALCGDGTEVWISFLSAPLFNEGRDEGSVITFHDISGSKRTEEMLGFYKTQYLQLFNNPNEVVALLHYEIDADGEIIDAVFEDINELFSIIVGKAKGEIIGRTATEILGEEAAAEHLPMLRTMRGSGKAVSYETYIGHLDAFVRSVFAPVSDNMFILSSRDITKVTLARRQLKENSELFRRQAEELKALMDAVPSAVWIALDQECKVITGNKAADAFYEARDDENVSAGPNTGDEWDTTRRFFKDGRELRPEELPMQLAAATGTEIRGYEIDVLVPSGRKKTMLGDAIPLFDSEGNVRGSVASFMDITARKEVERTNAFQAHLLASVDDAIIAMDHRFRIIYWNRMAERIFGWTEQEAMGRDSNELLRAKLPTPQEKLTNRLLQERQINEDVAFYHKSGQEVQTSVHVNAVVDRDGNISEYVASFRDIGERKRVERDLKEYSRKLELSNEELQQFGFITSHDLREPLRMITMYVDLINSDRGSQLSPEAREYMQFVGQGAERLKQLVNDILQYSSIETRDTGLTIVDMEQVARNVTEKLGPAIREVGATVNVHPLPIVMADGVQMEQLMTNLISNALKFHGPEPPVIEVNATVVGEMYRFSVQDNGIGIDPRYHKNLFKMFYRLHARDEYQGTGIGLAVCKKIVERHGGHIWPYSNGKKGSTFYFTLPQPRDGSDDRPNN